MQALQISTNSANHMGADASQATAHALAPRVVAGTAVPRAGTYETLHSQLLRVRVNDADRAQAVALIREQLDTAKSHPHELPESPDDLMEWLHTSTRKVTAEYESYLAERAAGSPRRYFANRAHALYFLKSVAPTKLVDGAWLYGIVAHAQNDRYEPLVRTYIEELGEGATDKNHVTLYRKLLAQHGLTNTRVDDALYLQGAVQLALGCTADEFLPEVIGFNLGYEQLPLHLLITAYELNELGIDPYYFTLHVTVDNGDTGHARAACDALSQAMPVYGDAGEFWSRVREGAKLGCVGVGTTQVIEQFDIDAEVLRIFKSKCAMGRGAHSSYCKVAGRSVNEWLAQPERMAEFFLALQNAGWIKRGAAPDESRFWKLLLGPTAEMFGVFSAYELQVIFDWIRGDESADGQSYLEQSSANQSRRRPSFRALARHAERTRAHASADSEPLDPDLAAFRESIANMNAAEARKALAGAMSPSLHWTPVGLYATRRFIADWRG